MKKLILPVLIGGCLFLSGCWDNKTEQQGEQAEEIVIVSEPTEQKETFWGQVAQETDRLEQETAHMNSEEKAEYLLKHITDNIKDVGQFKVSNLEELLEGRSGEQGLHDLIKKGNIIVDFYATWCPPCKAMHPILDKLAEAYHSHVKIIKIDIDKFKSLADKFEVDGKVLTVKGIPQFYFFKDGKLVDQHNGGATFDAFKQKIEKLIHLQ